MKNKKLVIAAVAVIVVIGLMVGLWMATRPETVEGAKTFTVTVVHSDGTGKETSGQVGSFDDISKS